MPPKKEVEAPKAEAWMLGKFSTNLKVGLVGLPNVGKSTLYNCLSKSHHAEAANYPFCTIDPNETRVFVEDPRFNWLVEHHKPKSEVKPFLNVVDIAGLVKGAAGGAGLGNAFLAHIRSVDGIIHVMRAFEDDDIIHAEDKVNPVADIEIISKELRIKDAEFMEKKLEAHKKTEASCRSTPQKLKEWGEQKDLMERILTFLDGGEGKDVRRGLETNTWSAKDIEFMNDYQLLTTKPVVYAVNLSTKDYARKKNKFLKPIKEWVDANGGGPIIPFSAELEMELMEMDAAAVKARCDELETTPGLDKLVKKAFEQVNLIYFYTGGPDEVRAWTIRKGYKAPQAAGVIHGDFERGFICAEVMAFNELKELGNEGKVKEAGRYRQEGKNYTVADGDVIFFKFNVSGPAKKK